MRSSDIVLRASQSPAHFICQDYINKMRRGEDDLVFISDGCSSSDNTDIGARLLLHNLMNEVGSTEKIVEECLWNALYDSKEIVNSLKIPLEALDCTIGYIHRQGNTWKVGIHGDGYIICIGEDVVVHKIEFPAGYPYYESMTLEESRLSRWSSIKDNWPTITTYHIDAKGNLVAKYDTHNYNRTGYYMETSYSFHCVMVSSDGLGSFVRPDDLGAQKVVPIEEVVPHIVNIPRWNGEFLKRRMHKFTDFCNKNSWRNLDDISIGAIYDK